MVSKLEWIAGVLLKPRTDGLLVKILAQQFLRVKGVQRIPVLNNVQPTAQLNACSGNASGERQGAGGC